MRIRTFILISFILLPAMSIAQRRHVLLADSLYRFDSYARAAKQYEKALKKTQSTGVMLGLGNSYYQLHQYSAAITKYRLAEADPSAWDVDSRLNYISSLRILGQEEEVNRIISIWDGLPGNRNRIISVSNFGKDIYYMDSAVFEVNRLELNSNNSEFGAISTEEGLLFVSSRGEGNSSNKKYHWNNEHYLDLFIAGKDGEIEPYASNSKFHDGPIAFFKDGSRVIYTRNEKVSPRKEIRQLGLYTADVSADGEWQNNQPLPFNSPDYSVSHPAISNDGSVIYFASNKPDGFGGTDIYKSVWNGTNWSEPVNLGQDINTNHNEMFPEIIGDELFFASDGHPGLGGLDIYIANDQGEGRFIVYNPGYPFNSSWDDFDLSSEDGRSGYISSNRLGNDDIYSFLKNNIVVEITYINEENERLDSVTTVIAGRSVLANTPNGDTRIYLDRDQFHELQANRITYADTAYTIETKDEFFIAKTVMLRPVANEDREMGYVDLYPVALRDSREDIYIGRKGRLLMADNTGDWKGKFSLPGSTDTGNNLEQVSTLFEKNGYEVRIHDRIEKIHFDFDKWKIRRFERKKLDQLVDLLNEYPAIRIAIGAHADKRGTDDYNMKLSARRAEETREYLVRQGINAERLSSNAFGESILLIICENCSEAAHEQNRRATFEITLED